MRVQLTKEGMEKLQAEIQHLKQVEVKECIEAISDARDKGDLSENAEYDVAKERYDALNVKIAKLSELLSNAVVINMESVNTDVVQILTKVKLKDLIKNKEIVYTIVAHPEVNLKEGKISVNSPVAQALIGKSKGDSVEVNIPSGAEMRFEILDISI
jgi:transcription elongation factor GreA